jgi:alkylated DNA repair dioxygenase AlkB
MSEVTSLFQQEKYVVLRGLVREPLLSSLHRYGLKRSERPTEWEKINLDADAPHTPASYADPMMDMLLANLTPQMEQATGLRLYPTFSFYRVYQRGDRLARHTDRPACEIALSVNLGYRGEHPWPIWVEGAGGAASILLEPGDAVLYRGMECPHWRDPLEGEYALQAFLFWVDQDGPHAEWKFDKREKLSSFLGR